MPDKRHMAERSSAELRHLPPRRLGTPKARLEKHRDTPTVYLWRHRHAHRIQWSPEPLKDRFRDGELMIHGYPVKQDILDLKANLERQLKN